MRVAYVCADAGIPVWGNRGCSIHVQEILRALVGANVDVDLIAMRAGGDRPAGLAPVVLHLIGAELPRDPAAREQACGELNQRVGEVLAALGPFDAVYERHSLWSYAGVEFAQRKAIPGLLEVNSRLVDEQATHRVLIDRDGAMHATRRAFQAASAVLCVSNGVADYVRGFGRGREHIHVVPNAVNPAYFIGPTQRMRESTTSDFTIGFVGTLKPWHGVDRLIAAYERLWDRESGWRLRIVGDGPDRERLESLARSLPAQVAASIEFAGMIPHAEVPFMLATFDVAVTPGIPGEEYFSPLKVFEYMAAGLPIVAARLGQIASIVEHGVTGLLYNPGDSGDLADALLRVRANPVDAARMGEARREVVACHTWDKRCDAILRMIRADDLVPAQGTH